MKYKKYLALEERNCWWKINHKQISNKYTESKFKRNKDENLVIPKYPLCSYEKEAGDYYNYECQQITTFGEIITEAIGRKLYRIRMKS